MNSLARRVLNASEFKVWELIEKSPYSITPAEIASETHLKHVYVRGIVRKLKDLRFVHQPSYGHYESIRNLTTLPSMGQSELLANPRERIVPHVHQLAFTVRGAKGVEGRRVVLDSDAVRVIFTGAANGTVVVHVKGEFDAVSFPLLIAFIRAKLHVREGQIKPTRIQWNNDLQGLTLEGANALTVKGIHGDLVRLYNRGHPSLRREVQTVRAPSSIAEVDALLQGGGLPSYYILQGLGLLVDQIKELFKQQKATTELSVRTTLSLEELAKGVLKRLDTLDRLEERLNRMSGS